ncbi:hypothetical protein QQ045_026298 [Rhodiola kirilowii]
MGRARRIEDEFEETLSLIDLPITPMKPSSDHQQKSCSFLIQDEDVKSRACLKTEESEFNFGSLTGSPSTRMEMSSADELFLHGQILPLRLSVDSKMSRVTNPGRPDCASDSASFCRSSSIEFTSVSSSRSSSYSSTSSRSVNVSNAAKTTPYKPRIRNQFHAHPSPTPRIRSATSNVNMNSSSRCRKSSVWDIFRLGPVQAPGIELKDLKSRNHNNFRAASFIGKGSKNSSDQIVSSKATLKQRMFGLSGCRCSADAVDNVQSRIVIIKSAERPGMERRRRGDFKEGEIEEELRRKIEEARRRRMQGKVEEEAEEGFPSRRTFEWLKQLPIEGDGNRDLNIKY